MQLKICGLKNPANVRQLLELEPDCLGFIFYEKSPRRAGDPAGLAWVKNLPGKARKVGVFVNAEADFILSTVEQLGLQVAQLHGDEPPEFCKTLKGKGLEVWKAFAVGVGFDFEKTKPYADACTCFLFDAKGQNRGGNGIPFDWRLLRKYGGETPFWLSGGIAPEDAWRLRNLSKTGRLGKFWVGADINSRFETEPGIKDFDLAKKFKHELFG